ncbi:MAG: hypothetical protein JO323_25295 [Acidobacteriia bacterium]|nr:hypothetical protein [Terriglobia bacterium]
MKRYLRPAYIMIFVLLVGAAIHLRALVFLTDNLSSTSSGSDTVSGSTLLGADFTTDADNYLLESATLLVQQDTSGVASLYVYSDNSGIPGSLLGTFASPASYTSSLSSTVFTASGLPLSADTTYWLVLSGTTGSFDWSWTTDNSASSAGFTGDTASYDGSYWYGTSGVYPYQLSVTADPVSATPEPSMFFLLLAASVAIGVMSTRKRLAKPRFQGENR